VTCRSCAKRAWPTLAQAAHSKAPKKKQTRAKASPSATEHTEAPPPAKETTETASAVAVEGTPPPAIAVEEVLVTRTVEQLLATREQLKEHEREVLQTAIEECNASIAAAPSQLDLVK